jgi:hypothetical protein
MSKKAVVYSVGADIRYQSLRLYSTSEEFAALPGLGGLPVGKSWPAPSAFVEPEEKDAPAPDIWGPVGHGPYIAMSAEVIDRLEPFISLAAEVLPLKSQAATGQILFVLNVLNPLDVHTVIDTSFSDEDRIREVERDRELVERGKLRLEDYETLVEDVREGELYPVLYPAFIEDRLPTVPTFFTIDRLAPDIFLLDHEDEDDTLVRRIDEFGITGLARQMIWSSETGPKRLNLFRDV